MKNELICSVWMFNRDTGVSPVREIWKTSSRRKQHKFIFFIASTGGTPVSRLCIQTEQDGFGFGTFN